MAWEHRGNNKYYYRKKRLGKRVISEYVGRGVVAELVAASDVMNRNQRKMERKSTDLIIQNLKKTFLYSDKIVKDFENKVDTVIKTHLILNGYHWQNCEWRKIRHDQKEKISC